MYKFQAKFFLKLIFLISFISLISAYFIEFILGHQPCNLCLIERIPYGISMILIIIISIYQKNEKFFVLLLILTFIFSLTISIYHFGVEKGFFEESAICSIKNFSETLTKEDLLKQLNEMTVSCKDVTFRIFGLSLTGINILISLFIIIMLLKTYNLYEKNR
tara:strand:+ start:539 stop:1024 length:486 start_codon:yes stop_codon:yes gene_type:complete